MYFCFIYGPFLVLRMFKIICYVDDIIGSDVQGHGLIYARYIKLPLLCSYVSTLYSSMFIGFYGWSCFLTMLCFFLYVIGLMLFWRSYGEKWGWLYHHEKAWVINRTSSFFIVACQVLLMYATLWWHCCWFYGWFEGIMGSMLIYHLICW